jgi:hypothetical protein
MNEKKLACVLLLMTVAVVAYGTQVMTIRARTMRQQAEAASMDAATARTDAETANIGLIRLKSETQDLRQFLSSWTPSISRLQSGQDAEQALLGIIRNSGILVVSQKFETKENRGANALLPKSIQGTLTVQDDYAKTVNWLGELECKVPLIRITSCRVKQGETGRQLNLEIHFEVPLVDLNANLDKK